MLNYFYGQSKFQLQVFWLKGILSLLMQKWFLSSPAEAGEARRAVSGTCVTVNNGGVREVFVLWNWKGVVNRLQEFWTTPVLCPALGNQLLTWCGAAPTPGSRGGMSQREMKLLILVHLLPTCLPTWKGMSSPGLPVFPGRQLHSQRASQASASCLLLTASVYLAVGPSSVESREIKIKLCWHLPC